MIRKIIFTIIMFYSCSFVSASAVERPNIKALPLFLLLGATQVYDAIGKPLVQSISNVSTTVATNVTSTTVNIISEILKQLVALQQKENIQGSQIKAVKTDITQLQYNDDFYYVEQNTIKSNISSLQAGLGIAVFILGIFILCLCSVSHTHKS